MTMKFALKAGCAALAFAGMAAAHATPFYVDIGTDYDPIGTNQVTGTSTSMKTEFNYQYRSSTTIIDATNNGITVGDVAITNAGLGVGGYGSNNVTGFDPNQGGPFDSNNGLGTNWGLTFNISNLLGQVTSITDGVSLGYGAGLLEMYVTTNFTTFINFMDIQISGGGAGSGGSYLFGTVDFTGVTAADRAAYGNLFHTGGPVPGCSVSSGFYDIWNGCGSGVDALDIALTLDFNTNALIAAFTAAGSSPTVWTVTTNHNGSGVFDIPEPGSLALLGLAMAGLGLTQRRRKQV